MLIHLERLLSTQIDVLDRNLGVRMDVLERRLHGFDSNLRTYFLALLSSQVAIAELLCNLLSSLPAGARCRPSREAARRVEDVSPTPRS